MFFLFPCIDLVCVFCLLFDLCSCSRFVCLCSAGFMCWFVVLFRVVFVVCFRCCCCLCSLFDLLLLWLCVGLFCCAVPFAVDVFCCVVLFSIVGFGVMCVVYDLR